MLISLCFMTTENLDFLKKCKYSGYFTREREVEENLQKSEARLQKTLLQILQKLLPPKWGSLFKQRGLSW